QSICTTLISSIFFDDTATTDLYTLSLHDALPIYLKAFQYYMQGRSYINRRTREDQLAAIHYCQKAIDEDRNYALAYAGLAEAHADRKSTRLNSSHDQISYAVFCLKKKTLTSQATS